MAVLRGTSDDVKKDVGEALIAVDNLGTFAKLLIQEAKTQADDKKKKDGDKKEDITITTVQCKS